ncbi:MAG: cytochrome c biogenesis heme-transporting ATPase CcmA [Gammaproteobacteria bacterium]|nr:MAG: cytochrome c biogenesis heme-transporting ATPase CcmA [Gammaproteobacteria bacterium]
MVVDSVSAIRGQRSLFMGVSAGVKAGDILQLGGANGAGKTTLLQMMAGLTRPHSGCIRWNGAALPAAQLALSQSLAWLGHQNGLKSALTPLENLRWALGVAGVAWQEPEAIRELVALGLAAVLEQPVATLSAGQKRRVALARVFLSQKPLWVLDEPLTALDQHIIPLVEARLREHAARGGLLVLTAHQPMALGEAHRVLQLGDGDA